MALQVYGERARDLARVAQLEGFILTFGEALRAVSRYRGSINKALSFIRDNAPHVSSGNTRSRLERNINMLGSVRSTEGRKRRQTDNTINNEPRGSDIVLQSFPGLTKDYLSCGKYVRKSLGPLYAQRTGVFNVKRLNAYYNTMLSTLLNFNSATVDGVAVQHLPMYAINLSSLAWQGQGSTTVGGYNTVPCYRLVRTAADLSSTVTNYYWVRQQNHVALDTQPVDNSEGFQFCWNRLSTDGAPCSTPIYKHHWSNISLLFNCGEECDCTIHTDIVTFPKDGVGPRRQFWNLTTDEMRYMDVDVTGIDRSSIDTFWESFWAHRIVHPLARYQIPNKEKMINFIHKGSLKINQSHAAADANQRHLRKVFWSDGRIRNLKDNVPADRDGVGTLNAQNLVNNPVNPTLVTEQNVNMISSGQNCLPYDRARKRDVWLLVYADMLVRPETESSTPIPCSFDYSIENKYSWLDTGFANTSTFEDGGAAPALV